MNYDLEAARLKKDWAENPRWKGIQRGYTAEDLHDAWETYLPPSQDEESETSETSETSGKNANISNAENVSDDDDESETSATANETAADNVSDGEADVSDDVSDDRAKNANNMNAVSDVSLVSLPPETDRDDDDLRYLSNSGKSELQSHHDALWRRGDYPRGTITAGSSQC